MNNLALRKLIIVAGIPFLLLVAFWWLFISSTFVKVQLPAGADSYQLRNLVGGTTGPGGKSSGLRLIERGSYLVQFYKGTTTVGVKIWQPGALPFTSLTAEDVDKSRTATAVMGDTADFVTPLPGGDYIYLNRRTKAVEIADAAGLHNVSPKFGLSTNVGQFYNAVVNILPTADNSVLVTTTKAVYVVKSQQDVVKLRPFILDFSPNFFGAAYDQTSKSVFLLNSYDRTVYKYDLTKPSAGLQKFYTAKSLIQSIGAGGGKIVVYSNNLPTTEAAAVKKFSERILTTPVVLDTSSKKQIATLDSFTVPTLALPSESGNFIAIKQKFATTLHIYDTVTNQDVVIPAYDVSGITWVGTTLYLARSNAIWAYKPGDAKTSLQKVAEIGSGVTRLTASGNNLTASSLDNVAYTIDLASDTKTAASNALSSVKLEGNTYTTSFTAIGSELLANTQSFDAVRGGGIGADATKANAQLKAAFPDKTANFTINQNPFTGYYLYQPSGE